MAADSARESKAMTTAKKALRVDAAAEIDRLLALLPQINVEQIKSVLVRRYRLKCSEVERLPRHLVAIVRVRKFVFARHVPPTSRALLILHCLGHYHLICGVGGGLRAGFFHDAGANDFAISLLAHDPASGASEILRRYETGDMGHILGVLRGDENPGARHGLHDSQALAFDGIDWPFIEQFQPEIHFFLIPEFAADRDPFRRDPASAHAGGRRAALSASPHGFGYSLTRSFLTDRLI